MSEPLAVAVIGGGTIGRRHAEDAFRSDRMRLAKLVDVDARVAPLAARLGADFLTDVDALMSAGLPPLVVIASPSDLHHEQTRRILDADPKVRIHLQKPPTIDFESTVDLMDCAGAADRVSVGFMRRASAPHVHMKRLVETGQVGKLLEVRSYLEDSSGPPAASDRPTGIPSLIVDTVIHNLDEIEWLVARKPLSVNATGSRIYSRRASHREFDSLSIQVTYDGAAAAATASWHHVTGNRVETQILGTEGTIHLFYVDTPPADEPDAAGPHFKVILTRKEAPTAQVERFAVRACEDGEPQFIPPFEDAYRTELDEVARRTLRGEAPYPPLAAGHDAMLLADSAWRSMKEGRRVDLS